MKPINTKDCNATLVADGCQDLPAWREETQQGTIYRTFWQLSDAEREGLLKNGVVMLSIFANAHPPVLVEVGEPIGYSTSLMDGAGI